MASATFGSLDFKLKHPIVLHLSTYSNKLVDYCITYVCLSIIMWEQNNNPTPYKSRK